MQPSCVLTPSSSPIAPSQSPQAIPPPGLSIPRVPEGFGEEAVGFGATLELRAIVECSIPPHGVGGFQLGLASCKLSSSLLGQAASVWALRPSPSQPPSLLIATSAFAPTSELRRSSPGPWKSGNELV